MDLYQASLKKILQVKRDKLDLLTQFKLCWQIFYQVTEALNYLHLLKPKILHLDLKPDNILVDGKNRTTRFIKIADFGLASIHSEEGHFKLVGTEEYMAPEVRPFYEKDVAFNEKADIYSLAVIGIEVFDVVDIQLLQVYLQ